VDIALLRRRRFLVLLTTLGIAVVVQSLNQGLVRSSVVTDALVILTASVVFVVVFEHMSQRLVALAVAIAAIVITGARYFLPRSYELPLAVAYNVLLFLFLGWAVMEILRGLFAGRPVQRDDILGAVCGYLIASAAWANLYALSELLVPGCFNVSPELQGQLADWHGRHALFTYFSLVTLTTLGYGDVTPDRAPATALVLAEAVFGQFYVAIVVAQLVAMRLMRAIDAMGPKSK
jgi:Ion channel